MFGLAELGGALLGGYPQQIKHYVGQVAMTYPQIHGLVGVSDIDRTILNKIESTALSRLHTFHLHAHGLAIVVFIINVVIASTDFNELTRKILHVVTCIGLLYPFGWLMIVFALPFYGEAKAFHLAEKMFFIPFGGIFLLALWGLILLYLVRAVSSRQAGIR